MLIALLGSHPLLSLAELERIYGDARLHTDSIASFDGTLYPHLGGSGKIAQVITTLDTNDTKAIGDYLHNDLANDVLLPRTKLDLGFSFYGRTVKDYRPLIFSIKKRLRTDGFKPRIILPKAQALSTAQVFHHELTDRGYEFIVSIGKSNTIIARTAWVQDIESYTKRDMQRPRRDMEVGMLPPKLAQMMVNLAGGDHVFDPFCGTGVILQEALLMGKSASGSDLSAAMVEATNENLAWLGREFETQPPSHVFAADARSTEVPAGCDAIVSEGYLGPVLRALPSPERARKLAAESSRLMEATLRNLQPQLADKTPLCLALPAWHTGSGIVLPPLIDTVEQLGYNRVRLNDAPRDALLYRRPEQFVGRNLILLEKS